MELLKVNKEYVKNLTEKEKRELLEQVNSEISTVESLYNQYKSFQLALKLVINGTYGAFAHPKFVVSNKFIANAITIHGRDIILYMLAHIEEYFFTKWHLDKEIHDLLTEQYIGFDDNNRVYMLNKKDEIVGYRYEGKDDDGNITEKHSLSELIKAWNITPTNIKPCDHRVIETTFRKEKVKVTIKSYRKLHDFSNVRPIDSTVTGEREEMDGHATFFHKEDVIQYGDTDSVDYQTVIRTNQYNNSIEDFYNRNIINGSNGETLKGHESVKTNEKVLNYSKEKGLYFAPVKRIIRHTVTKDKWKLKTKSGKEILITNDHSLIVFRNGIQTELKPKDVLKTDKILIIKNNI
jgi:DNA polymerase elongation subunit (family B)